MLYLTFIINKYVYLSIILVISYSNYDIVKNLYDYLFLLYSIQRSNLFCRKT